MKKDINVFIGGSIDQKLSINYAMTAKDLGKKINERDYKIIFDGCSGLPALVFDELSSYDRAIIYYTRYYRSEYINDYFRLTSPFVLHAVELETQSQMTDTIIAAADAFIFMKGQMGTLEEMSRVINGNKNKEYRKPIVFLNVEHEWDDLMGVLASYDVGDYYHVTDNVSDALNYIEEELFKETSDFYQLYVSSGYAKRNFPIIMGEEQKYL